MNVVGDKLVKIAEIYDIRLVEYERTKDCRHIIGPRYHALDLDSRTVFVDWEFADNVETLLHEMMHIITHPPGFSIDVVCEGLLLLQFERALARAVFPPHVVKKVIDWQLDTKVRSGAQLSEIVNYEHCGFWRRGFSVCRRIGLLDSRNRPTWKLPDWSVFEKEELKKLVYD